MIEVYKEGRLACGYHGWEYAADGRIMRVRSYRAASRYAYVWVTLEDPIHNIAELRRRPSASAGSMNATRSGTARGCD